MEQDQYEARDNIRQAARASLLFDTFPKYQKWAKAYLQQTEPLHTDPHLWDMANDITHALGGLQPSDRFATTIDACHAILAIFRAVDFYHKGDWQNASNSADEALGKMGEVHKAIGRYLDEYARLVKRSIHCGD